MKRRSIIALLALVMCLALLTACGGNSEQDTPEPPTDASSPSGSTEEQPQTPEPETTTEAPTQEKPATEAPTEPEPEAPTEPEPAVPAEMTYTFDADTGTLTCSGGGEVVLDDWLDVVKTTLFETNVIAAMNEVKKVIVEQGVTSLGDDAFGGCINLTEAVLPDTLTRIGRSAFRWTALTGITIPESVTEFGDYAFEECHDLTSINLPGGITEIPNNLFNNCESLTSIEIPEGVTRIGKGAFLGTALTELTIPEGVTDIENYFIGQTSITSITLPSSLTKWTSTTFDHSKQLTDVTILCEATMDNVGSLVDRLLRMSVTIHAPAGSVIEGYVNRQIQTGNATCTFEAIS